MILEDHGKTQLVEINIQIKQKHFPHKNNIIIVLVNGLLLINIIIYYYVVVWSGLLMVDAYRRYLCKHVFILNPIIVILTRVYPTPEASVYVFIIYHQYPLSSWQIMDWLGMELLLFLVESSSPASRRPWHYDILTLILTCDIQYFLTNFHSNILPVTSTGSVKVPVIKYTLYMRICHHHWRVTTM